MSAFSNTTSWVRLLREKKKKALGGCLGKTEQHPRQNILSRHQAVIPTKAAEMRTQPES